MAYTNVPSGWKTKKVTASGQVLGAGAIYGGIMMPIAGTSSTVTVYDDTSAVAANTLTPTTAALTAGQFVSPTSGVVPITANAGLADGLVLNLGLYITVGGTGSPTFLVLYK